MSKLPPLSALSGSAPGRRMQRFLEQGRLEEALDLVAQCSQQPTTAHGIYLARMLLDYVCICQVPEEHQAALAEHADTLIGGLVDAGAEANRMALAGVDPALTLAVGNANLPVVQALLRRGADPNLRSTRDDSHCLALIASDDTEMARSLLDHGADPHAQCGWDGPVLWHAAAKGHTNTMSALVEAGADPHFIDESGNTLVHHLIERTTAQSIDTITAVMRLVLTWGVDLDVRNRAGHTARELAAASFEREALLRVIDAALANRQAQALDEGTLGIGTARQRTRL